MNLAFTIRSSVLLDSTGIAADGFAENLLNFQGWSVSCSVFNVRLPQATAYIIYHRCLYLSTTFFEFFSNCRQIFFFSKQPYKYKGNRCLPSCKTEGKTAVFHISLIRIFN